MTALFKPTWFLRTHVMGGRIFIGNKKIRPLIALCPFDTTRARLLPSISHRFTNFILYFFPRVELKEEWLKSDGSRFATFDWVSPPLHLLYCENCVSPMGTCLLALHSQPGVTEQGPTAGRTPMSRPSMALWAAEVRLRGSCWRTGSATLWRL